MLQEHWGLVQTLLGSSTPPKLACSTSLMHIDTPCPKPTLFICPLSAAPQSLHPLHIRSKSSNAWGLPAGPSPEPKLSCLRARRKLARGIATAAGPCKCPSRRHQGRRLPTTWGPPWPKAPGAPAWDWSVSTQGWHAIRKAGRFGSCVPALRLPAQPPAVWGLGQPLDRCQVHRHCWHRTAQPGALWVFPALR